MGVVSMSILVISYITQIILTLDTVLFLFGFPIILIIVFAPGNDFTLLTNWG